MSAVYRIHNTDAKPMQFELLIAKPPEPLVLLINPTTLEIKFTPKVMEQRTRWTGIGKNTGYIFQAQHDELDVMTASGRSAMFMTAEKGLTRQDKTETYAFENIERLVQMYRNNGVNRNKKPDTSVSAVGPCAINSVGAVLITYNEFMYKGYFSSFSITEIDTSPFNVDFSFEFKVFKTFDRKNYS